MKSANWARMGLAAFAAVFVCSLVALVAGSLFPTYAHPLEVGDRVGSMVLNDAEGTPHELLPSGRRMMLLVYAPETGLTSQQAARVADLQDMLRQRTAIETVAIVPADDPKKVDAARSVSELVVMDPRQSLWALQSTTPDNATVCLIDSYGCLRFRGELPPEEAIAQSPHERPLLRIALAAVEGR